MAPGDEDCQDEQMLDANLDLAIRIEDALS
jgi:hypothetical protein